jgi:hypothetical protein
LHNGLHKLQIEETSATVNEDEECTTPIKPSAKALGKRKVVEDEDPDRKLLSRFTVGLPLMWSTTGPFDPDDIFYDHRDEQYPVEDKLDSDSDDLSGGLWSQPVHYVYDAAAERTQQRIRRGRVSTLVDGVH